MAALAQKFLPGVQVVGLDTFGGMPPTDRTVDAHPPGGFSDVDLAELRQFVEWLAYGTSNLCRVLLKKAPQRCWSNEALLSAMLIAISALP